MQEDVEHRTVSLAISATKLTASVLKEAISRYLAYKKTKSTNARARDGPTKSGPVKPTGKQTVKELIGQNEGVTNIEVASSGIRDFQRIARKYGVDYAIRKVKSEGKTKYLVFFRAKDSDALTAAFQEYTGKVMKKRNKPHRTSVLEELYRLSIETKTTPSRSTRGELER
ncbi:MAG: PcfB family protein [Oscillospiraceae bacterium]|nr:PcfB family protein [Oscillospiraceae bacterium]